MKFLRKVRDKLFLNAMQSMLHDSERRIESMFHQEREELIEWQTFTAKKIGSMILAAAQTNRETFLPFKNYCKGKKLVICGAGPSLADFKPIDDAVYIALNRAVLFDKVDFDFLFVLDWYGIRHIQKEVLEYKGNNCVKLFAQNYAPIDWMFRINTPESFVSACGGKRFCTDVFTHDGTLEYLFKSEFVVDIDRRPLGCFLDVFFEAVQFALYMNPEKIYLAGLDHKGGHFSYKNLSEDQKEKDCQMISEFFDSVLEKVRLLCEKLKDFASVYYPDTEIVSVNPVGLKGIFKDWYQAEGDEPDSRQNV